MRYLLPLLLLLFAADLTSPPILTTQPSDTQPKTQPQTLPLISLPLDRSSYVVGEDIPLGTVSPNPKIHLTALDPFGQKLDLYTGSPGPLRFKTAALAPGPYRLFIDEVQLARIVLVSPLRRSSAIFSDETLPPGVIYYPNQILDPDLRAKADQAWHDNVVKTLQDTGINVCFDMGDSDPGQLKIHDTLLETQTLVYNNPYTRPMSFFPVRVYEPEVRAFRQKLALTAQANARYPNFGGFLLEWDPTGFLTRQGLFTYWNWGDSDADLKDYVAKSDKALYDDFEAKTGLKPVAPDEYMTYTLGLNRPDFTPAIDLPTRRWLEEIAAHLPKPDPAKMADLQKRVDAWSAYLMGLYESEHKADAAVLKSIEPSLQLSGSNNLDHNAVKDGQYAPSAYRNLDFRYMSAWNDQIAGPDYDYQWLLSAAMMNIERKSEPLWVGTSAGFVHDISPYPGKLMRVIAQCYSQGATGVGFSLEGFSDPLGGMNADANWSQIKDTDKAEELRTGREFADRFAFLSHCPVDHGVAILYSKTQMQRQYLAQGMLTPQWLALVTLTRLGYSPRLVTEEEIDAGVLDELHLKALVILQQTFAMPDSVTKKIESFAKSGKIVAVDHSTTISLAGAKLMDYQFPRKDTGRPFAWGSPNYVLGDSHMRLAQDAIGAFAPAADQTLNGSGKACYVSDKGLKSKVAIMQCDGGDNVKYLVVTNESCVTSQGDWYQVTEKLIPNDIKIFADIWDGGAIYDLTEEKQIGKIGDPINCDLTKTTVRVYALTSHPAGLPEAYIVNGSPWQVGLMMQGGVNLPIRYEIKLPNGQPWVAGYRRSGEFLLDVPSNLPNGDYHLVLHSQLNGETVLATQTINSKSNLPEQTIVSPPAKPLFAELSDDTRHLLNGSIKDRKVVIPIFESPHKSDLLAAAKRLQTALKNRGVDASILVNPPMGVYTVSYKATPELEKENQNALQGRTIGKIDFQTVNRNDYASGLAGYVWGGNDVILLNLPGNHVNDLAQRLDSAGLIWPQLTPGFPGPGGAIIADVPGAFDPAHTAIVIQAQDPKGLDLAIDSLSNLPDSSFRQSVSLARAALHAPEEVPRKSNIIVKYPSDDHKNAPQPLHIHFGKSTPPLEADVKPLIRPVHKPLLTPASIRTGDLIPQIRTVAGTLRVPSAPDSIQTFEDAWSPGGSWLGDTRFADAWLFVLGIDKSGPMLIQFDGLFRYPDKHPKSQPQWDDILALRDKWVPFTHDGMSVEVLVDGKSAGVLDHLDEDLRWVETSMVPDPVTKLRPTQKEPAVVRISGTVNLPEGIHQIILVPHRIVDGQIDGVFFDVKKPLLKPMK